MFQLLVLGLIVILLSDGMAESLPAEDCSCDCQHLKMEINILKQMLSLKPNPVPELLGSITDTLTPAEGWILLH